jgi:hypothetical protein
MTLFEKLFALVHGRAYCEHKWVILHKGPILDPAHDPMGYFYNLQCEKCGNVKRKNTYVNDK